MAKGHKLESAIPEREEAVVNDMSDAIVEAAAKSRDAIKKSEPKTNSVKQQKGTPAKGTNGKSVTVNEASVDKKEPASKKMVNVAPASEANHQNEETKEVAEVAK